MTEDILPVCSGSRLSRNFAVVNGFRLLWQQLFQENRGLVSRKQHLNFERGVLPGRLGELSLNQPRPRRFSLHLRVSNFRMSFVPGGNSFAKALQSGLERRSRNGREYSGFEQLQFLLKPPQAIPACRTM